MIRRALRPHTCWLMPLLALLLAAALLSFDAQQPDVPALLAIIAACIAGLKVCADAEKL